jgi:SAM-dependent methyltransferase
VADLTFRDLTVPQGVAMAEGLIRAKMYPMAGDVLRSMLGRANDKERRYIRRRLTLVQGASARTPWLYDALERIELNTTNVFVGDGLATWMKAAPFMEDERFLSLADRHAALIPIAGLHWNLSVVLWAVKRAKAVEGDFVELGVFKGHTTAFCAEYLGFQDWAKTWFLYDTFDGVPDDQLDAGWADANRRAYKNTFSYDEVLERFAPYPNIRVTQGRVPEILAEVCPDKIAFMHVDLNNSQAEIAALDALYDRVTPGGVIVFDDFAWDVSGAQRQAETKWFADRGLEILALPTGQGLFVKPAA